MSGLSNALFLSKNGYKKITIFESRDSLTGLLMTHKSPKGLLLENFYHHLFTSDYYINSLIKDIGLKEELFFKKVKTSHLFNNKIYDIGSISEILKSDLLSNKNKLRFLFVIASIKFLPGFFWTYSNDSAANFSFKLFGKRIHKLIWLPLLKRKFSDEFKLVPASWLIARIKCRSLKLGYLHSSFDIFYKSILERLNQYSVEIRQKTKILKIDLNKKKVILKTINSEEIFDAVILCCPQKICESLLSNKLKSLCQPSLQYLSATCVVFYLDKNPFNDYWINYCDEDTKALAIINHCSLIDNKKKDFPIYVAYYHKQDDDFFKPNNQGALIKDARKALRKVYKLRNDSLNGLIVKGVNVFHAKYAQPILHPYIKNSSFKDYKVQKIHPNKNMPIFFSNMHCIYPEDRGQNYSLKVSHMTKVLINKFFINSSL